MCSGSSNSSKHHGLEQRTLRNPERHVRPTELAKISGKIRHVFMAQNAAACWPFVLSRRRRQCLVALVHVVLLTGLAPPSAANEGVPNTARTPVCILRCNDKRQATPLQHLHRNLTKWASLLHLRTNIFPFPLSPSAFLQAASARTSDIIGFFWPWIVECAAVEEIQHLQKMRHVCTHGVKTEII